MKREIHTIEHFAKLGIDSRETPFLDEIEKLVLMCEYFEIILDCLAGKLPSKERFMLGSENEETDELEEDWDIGVHCGCGGNCLCSQES